MEQRMILVTGGNGQLGKEVVAALKKRVPAGERLAVSVRDPAKAAALNAEGIEIRRGDFDDKASLLAAFAGADRVLIISADAPNEVRIRQHRTAVDAAKEAGVTRLAYTSFVDHAADSPFPFAAIHHDTEAYIARAGVPYTILRNGPYAELIQTLAGRAVETGSFALPAGDGKAAFITRADIAAATAVALVSDKYVNATLTLAGEAAVSFHEIAALLSAQLGRPVRYVVSDRDAYRGALLAAGLPEFLATAITGIHLAIRDGRYAGTSTTVRELTGKAPEDVATYIKRGFPRAAA
jgi:NAD(P)H dehydrogenase (quinone)